MWREGLRRWLGAFAQPVTYLGVTMLFLLGVGLTLLLNEDRRNAFEDAERDGTNLTRVFEEYIAATFTSADTSLRLLRKLYQQDPNHFDISAWGHDLALPNNVSIHFALIGPDGIVRASSLGAAAIGMKVGNRDQFRITAQLTTDELYISKPVRIDLTGQQAIVLARRLTAPDGSFAGVITASLDPMQLGNFYGSLDLGEGGIVSLIGFDGIVRARGARGGTDLLALGRSVGNAEVMHRFKQSSAGMYWNRPGFVDDVRRLITYRVVAGFPLIAIVGTSEADIYRGAAQTAKIYYMIYAVLAIAILLAIVWGAVRQIKLAAATEALARTNSHFDAALQNMAHGLCLFDRDQRLIVCNERYGEMYGLTAEQTKPGTMLRSILEARIVVGSCPENPEAYIEKRLEEVNRTEPYYAVNELRDGRIFSITHRPMKGGGWVAIHHDITAQKQAERQVAYMAHHDALTGIANRTVLIEKMDEALTRLRSRSEAFTVFMLDLDLFKTVNDSLGHPVGDELLKLVAQRLTLCVNAGDVVVRMGGDEFAVLAANEGNQREMAIITASRILETLAAPYTLDGHHIEIGTSIGIALAPEHGEEVNQLMKCADLALYKAKAEGRSGYRFFEDAMGTEARNRRALEIDLRNAISKQQFELHYQPIVDIKTKQITSVEALVRWRHPERGMISPVDFIPIAEETGLINPLGEWVLRQACADAATWPSHVKVSVNLSPVQFRSFSPIEMFCNALSATGLPPERLEVEITESVLMQGNANNIETLHQLRSIGISIVLDDFGTGYSSLSYLRLFPFDKIKIDRSFVNELSKNSDCASIVSAVAGLGRSLRVATVAEGIETEDQLVLVRTAGCTHAQGYLFSRPRPAADLDFRGFREISGTGRAA
jgi:diguanylate cyclase (GGDEF)-like protein/PAS domain S-box-containing protein